MTHDTGCDRSPPVRAADDFLVFGAPLIEGSEIQELLASLRTGWIGTGPKVARFEEDFRAYKRATNAVAVSSCTAALHLSLLTAGLQPGDEVITTPLTFCATVNAIIHAGCIPVLADIDPRTMNVDPTEVEKRITDRTRALLPVHFAGRPCDMDDLMTLASRHDLKVIEDCAHAIETQYKDRHAGTFGDFGCFSFYVTKNVITGEGGMILCPSTDDAGRVKTLALHGLTKDAWRRFSDTGYKHYQVVSAGFKYNMTDLQAALGIHQLQRVERNWYRRQEIWDRYNDAFADLPVTTPTPPADGTRHAFHLYTILVCEERSGIARDVLLDALTAHGIGVGVHYRSIPEHPFYQETFGWAPDEFPHAATVGAETVSLPLSAKLTSKDVDDVITAVRRSVPAR